MDANEALKNSSGTTQPDYVGKAIDAGSGLAGSIIGIIAGKSAEKRQMGYQKELMGEQFKYNKESMDYAQELSKEMYEYTGYASKVRQLKEAGLNPALLYGGGAGSGGSTAAQSAPGVSGGQAPDTQRTVSNTIAASGMALQLAKLRSEIAVNESIAKANEAQATKTTEADIPKAQAETTNIKETLNVITQQVGTETAKKLGQELQNSYQTIQNHIANATEESQIRRIIHEADQVGFQNDKLVHEIRKTKADADVASQSVTSLVEANKKIVEKLGTEIIKNKAETNLTDEQAKNIIKEITLKFEQLKMNSTGQEIDLAKLQTQIMTTLMTNDTQMKMAWIRALSGMLSATMIRGGAVKVVEP